MVPVPLHLEAQSRTGPVDLEVHLLSARGEGGDANGAAIAARVGAGGHLAWGRLGAGRRRVGWNSDTIAAERIWWRQRRRGGRAGDGACRSRLRRWRRCRCADAARKRRCCAATLAARRRDGGRDGRVRSRVRRRVKEIGAIVCRGHLKSGADDRGRECGRRGRWQDAVDYRRRAVQGGDGVGAPGADDKLAFELGRWQEVRAGELEELAHPCARRGRCDNWHPLAAAERVRVAARVAARKRLDAPHPRGPVARLAVAAEVVALNEETADAVGVGEHSVEHVGKSTRERVVSDVDVGRLGALLVERESEQLRADRAGELIVVEVQIAKLGRAGGEIGDAAR